MTKTWRSLAGAHPGHASSPSRMDGSDTSRSTHAAKKTTGKKMFFFARADWRTRSARVSGQRAYGNRRLGRYDVEARYGFFFRAGC
jgi:hypothetical protein